MIIYSFSWLPFVETRYYDTYSAPSRPLWTLKQFEFCVYFDKNDVNNKNSNLTIKIRKQELPRPYGKSNISYNAGSPLDKIENHLVHAMQTDLDKPNVIIQPSDQMTALSFDEAFEIPPFNQIESSIIDQHNREGAVQHDENVFEDVSYMNDKENFDDLPFQMEDEY